MKTRITEILKIEYPIVMGGMAWAGTAKLAAAVSEAGALGVIGSGHLDPDGLREEIRRAKKMTSKPIGVNILLLSPFVDDLVKVAMEEGAAAITFGAGNPEPVFLATSLRVVGCRTVGKNHRRMTLQAAPSAGSKPLEAIWFNVDPSVPAFDHIGRLAYRLRWNRWNGRKIPQMVVEDVEIG